MTLKEGIYDIREAVNALNIDSDFTDRHIVFLMNKYRGVIVRQHLTSNPGEYRNQLMQTLFMEVELVDISQFPEYALLNLTMLATKKAVPNIIGQQMYKEIEVRTIERFGVEIEITHKERLTQVAHAPLGFIFGCRDVDGKLYLTSNSVLHKALTKITVSAILEDPESILDIHDLSTELEVYPITQNLWTPVKEMVVNHLLKELSIPTDTVVNNSDDTLPNGVTEKT